METIDKLFDPVIDFMAKDADVYLSKANPKWEPLLRGYNTMCSDEYDHAGYIYDTNNNEDLISLLKGSFSFADIAKATSSELPFVVIENEDGKDVLRGIDEAKMIAILKANLRDLMSCVVKYAPYCADYLEIYKLYVSCEFED